MPPWPSACGGGRALARPLLRLRRMTGASSDRASLAALRARLAAAGFFRPRPLGYAIRTSAGVAGFAVCFVAGARAHGVAGALAALGAAFFAVQLGIVSHEAGHRSLGHRAWVNDLFGHLGMTFVNGLGFSHWRHQHDHHHRTSQIDGEDPDMRFALVLSVTAAAAARRRGWVTKLQRFQALYFWLLAPFFAWSLRFDSAATASQGQVRGTAVDRLLLPAHYLLWLVVPAVLLGAEPGHVLGQYLLYSTFLSLYITVLFSANHLGLGVIDPERRPSYLRQQLEHSRNIRLPRALDFLFGGLHFHIEHHLFPRVPGHALRRGSRVVASFCRERGLRYPSQSYWQAVAEIHAQLSAAARALPRGPALEPSREQPA